MKDPSTLLEIISQHLLWYPAMEARDIYKLICQGVMGSEHLISSPQVFINYLAEEFEPLRPDPSGCLLEPIRSDGSLLRINLRPYKSRDLRTEVLVPALLETARSFKGDTFGLPATWMDFVHACEQGRFPKFDLDQTHQFTAWLEKLDFPAIHHSAAYNREYLPAYRLIAAEFIHSLGLDDAR
ncbi:MAG: hypothetical protein A2Z71_09645 [Chloroflexi bacterium RBG_13_50_21]|nr:MAG: hypothetical protein A2Z71_09645 [Chloroflexi bacterium RBG_13_50_21]